MMPYCQHRRFKVGSKIRCPTFQALLISFGYIEMAHASLQPARSQSRRENLSFALDVEDPSSGATDVSRAVTASKEMKRPLAIISVQQGPKLRLVARLKTDSYIWSRGQRFDAKPSINAIWQRCEPSGVHDNNFNS
jgi:hypothetical protein